MGRITILMGSRKTPQPGMTGRALLLIRGMRRVGWIMPISGGMRVGWGGLPRQIPSSRLLTGEIRLLGIDIHMFVTTHLTELTPRAYLISIPQTRRIASLIHLPVGIRGPE
jgi:hypothetical protein